MFPEIAKERRFAFDEVGLYTNNKAFIIPSDDLFLLGILNSSCAWEYIKAICAALGDSDSGGRVMLQWVNLQRLPIPKADEDSKRRVANLVRRCLNSQATERETIEQDIDSAVCALYGIQH